jgi:hypothetical protein
MSLKRTISSCLAGSALASTLFCVGAQAHECRTLGQALNEDVGVYELCVGFAYEDGVRPRAGTTNNLDFLPLWVVPGPDGANYQSLDTRAGDIVNVKVRLDYLDAPYYEIPHDENFNVTVPWFFFIQPKAGYSSPLGKPRFQKELNYLYPVETDEGISYRAPVDFYTPYAGLYAWVLEGTIKVRGKPPVSFTEKFVSAQPRIPYGPTTVNGTTVGDPTQAPEGWFDSVAPSDRPPHATALVGGQAGSSSPYVSTIMKRFKSR